MCVICMYVYIVQVSILPTNMSPHGSEVCPRTVPPSHLLFGVLPTTVGTNVSTHFSCRRVGLKAEQKPKEKLGCGFSCTYTTHSYCVLPLCVTFMISIVVLGGEGVIASKIKYTVIVYMYPLQ